MFNLKQIHSDKRGEIWILDGFASFSECKILKTNKGSARGGCVHTQDEYLVVLEGTIGLACGETYYLLNKGDSRKILANTPHYFYSIKDSVVSEWGASLEGTTKDPEFLKIVEEINGK